MSTKVTNGHIRAGIGFQAVVWKSSKDEKTIGNTQSDLASLEARFWAAPLVRLGQPSSQEPNTFKSNSTSTL